MMERVLKINEVADRLRLSHFSVRRLIKSGKLPRLGYSRKQILVDSQDLEDYISDSKVRAAEEKRDDRQIRLPKQKAGARWESL